LLQGGNGGFLLQALSKTMNIKLDRQSETYIREMIRRNRLYGSPSELVSKAIAGFYKQEKKSGFK
jgi:Arc/MetJ-type ribon-helix-helix transcriptional regulator